VTHPYGEYEGTVLWRALSEALDALEANQDVRVTTARPYIVGTLARALTEKDLVKGEALLSAALEKP
jgi:hypothetical protein